MHDDLREQVKDSTMEHCMMATTNYDMSLYFSTEGNARPAFAVLKPLEVDDDVEIKAKVASAAVAASHPKARAQIDLTDDDLVDQSPLDDGASCNSHR